MTMTWETDPSGATPTRPRISEQLAALRTEVAALTALLNPPQAAAPVKSTLSRRVWRRLGFRPASLQLPDDGASYPEGFWAPGWFHLDTRCHLDWRDRLRVLIGGRLMLHCAVRTDAPIARSETYSAVGILPPGDI
jgi:hypothetical protein